MRIFRIRQMKISFPNLIKVGMLQLVVEPWAEVYVDSNFQGVTPLAPFVVKSGEHQLILKHPQLGEWERKISIKPGETADIKVNLFNEKK